MQYAPDSTTGILFEGVPYDELNGDALSYVTDGGVGESFVCREVVVALWEGDLDSDIHTFQVGADGIPVRPPYFDVMTSKDTVATGDTTFVSASLPFIPFGFDPNFTVDVSLDDAEAGRLEWVQMPSDSTYETLAAGSSLEGVPYAVLDSYFAAPGSPEASQGILFIAAEEGGSDPPPAVARQGVQTQAAGEDEDSLVESVKISVARADDASKKGSKQIVIAEQNPDVRFIRQNNDPIPEAEDEGSLMVSKFVVTNNLPNNATFEGPTGSDPDPDTFRPQVAGLPDGRSIGFRVEVFRNGQPTGYNETFGAVEGTLNDGRTAYRGDEHLRLVSNKAPANAPANAQYDDGYQGEQTVLVKLGDVVRVTLRAGGSDTEITAELPVGRPPSEVGPNAIRTAEINFMTLSGVNSAPPTIVDRMSEDWAQAAVRFDLAGQSTITPVENALTLEGGTTGSDGVLQVDVDGQSVTVNVSAGQVLGAVALELSDVINDSTDATAEIPELNLLRGDPNNFERWVVVVDKGQNVTFSNITETVKNLSFLATPLNYNSPITETDANVLGLNFKDENDQTIDLFAVPDVASGKAGIAGFDKSGDGLPGFVNSIFVNEAASNLKDDLPNVAGHEAGHVLFNLDFPGDDSTDAGHSRDAENLMYPTADQMETYGGAKRLTTGQHDDARDDSGPGSNGPVLLQPKPLPGQQNPGTNNVRFTTSNEATKDE